MTSIQPIQDSPTDILHFEKWLGILGERGGTDLHLTVGNTPLLRLDGQILPLLEEEILTPERLDNIMAHLFSEAELKFFQEQKEIIASLTLKKIMRFRAHAFWSRGFPALSLRYVAADDRSAEELGIPEAVMALADAGGGLIIITGPFDAGKTTTVKTLLSKINHSQAKYIITFEKPVEYLLPSDKAAIIQREVGRDTPDYASGLAALAEEDVNVVMVGAAPDKAAAEQILQLANSGRLVVLIVSSRQAIGALEQIRDLYGESERGRVLNLLGDALLAVSAQMLLPKIGGGRILVSEVLLATNPVKSLIRDNKLAQIRNIMQTSRAAGMVTLDKALADAVKGGLVSLQDGRAHAIDPSQFAILVSH